MSMSATPDRPIPYASAYPRLRRVLHAFRFIRDMAALGSDHLERTKAKHVAATYSVEAELVRRIKARFRNELSFGDSGK